MGKSKAPPGWYLLDGSRELYTAESSLCTLEDSWDEAEDNAQPFVDEAVEQIAKWLYERARKVGEISHSGEEAIDEAADDLLRGDWKR